MKRLTQFLLFSVISTLTTAQSTKSNSVFDKYFENKTMRVDYIHGGNSFSEDFKIFGIKNDGEWGGRVRVMDDPYILGFMHLI